jgi:hypothetical protein
MKLEFVRNIDLSFVLHIIAFQFALSDFQISFRSVNEIIQLLHIQL